MKQTGSNIMGKPNSKSTVNHNEDPQIRVINTQEVHGELLDQQHFLLYVILLVVLAQLLLTLYILLVRRERKKALKIAKSIDKLTEV